MLYKNSAKRIVLCCGFFYNLFFCKEFFPAFASNQNNTIELKGHSDDTGRQGNKHTLLLYIFMLYVFFVFFGVKSINYNGNTQTREKLEEKRRKIHKKEICMFSKLKWEKQNIFWILCLFSVFNFFLL